MPAKGAATCDAAQVASTELSGMKDIKAVKPKMVMVADRPKVDKQSPQQFNPTENKTVNNIGEENLQTPKQTAETSGAVLSAKLRSKHQTQPDAYVIYPQYQSYVAPPPPIHAMSAVPGTTTTLPLGQQHVPIQCQTQPTPPHQVTHHPPMNSCDGDPVISSDQPYELMSQPLQAYSTEAQFYQYGWQHHSPPSVMSPYQPYPDAFQQFQQATLRTPYGCTTVQGVPLDTTRQHNRYGSQHPRDPKSSSIATCPKGSEYNCSWNNCQVPPSRPVSIARKEPERSTVHKAGSIPSSTMERADPTRTTTKSGNDFIKIKISAAKERTNPDLVFTQNLSTTRPSGSAKPTESSGNREWYRRENNLSSDSGWLSDNSSREEGEVVDDAVASMSPTTTNELSDHFQHGLCLESNAASSSTDESSYQESPTSSISSQCPSTSSDDNEQQQQQQHAPSTKKHQHQQQPRIMRAIPSRFVNLLHAAAENAALQRKRLEGYPLFRQMFFQRRYEDHHQEQDQLVCGPEMQQAELSLTNRYDQSASWYFPAGGYVQFQYQQSPASYVQGQYQQGAGISLCNQLGYSQGQQSNGCYVQSQQGPGGSLPGSYNQGSENYVQYNQGGFCYTQPSAVYMCSDQQCGQEYCPAVPVYIIQMDNPDVANGCTLYNTDCNSQANYEKQTQGYACPSNPSYAIPVPVQ